MWLGEQDSRVCSASPGGLIRADDRKCAGLALPLGSPEGQGEQHGYTYRTG